MFGKYCLLLLCLGLASCSSLYAPPTNPPKEVAPPPPPTQAEAVVRHSAQDLFEIYRDDPEDAEKKYNGKLIIVDDATIKSTHIYDGNKPCVNLLVPRDNNDPFIRCLFELEDKARVLALESGRKITIRGRSVGSKGGQVTLEQCIILRE